MDNFEMGIDCVGANKMGIHDAGYRKLDAESEDAVFPEFTHRVLDNCYGFDASDSRWLGEELDGVINLKPNYARKNRTPIKLGRGRCVFRRSRFMHPVKSVSSLESCLRAQFTDVGPKEVRPGSSSLFPSFSGQGFHCEIPFTGFNELMSSSGMNMHSDLQLFAFAAGNSHARNIKSVESDNDRPCSVAHRMEENNFNHNVEDVKRKTLRGQKKLSGEEGNVVEGRINRDKDTTPDQERQKLSILHKKRKASYQPISMLCDLAKASGSAWEVLLFSLGLGVGMKLTLDANRSEVESLSKKLIEAENTVQGLRKQLESRNKSFVVSNVSCSSESLTEDSNLQQQKDSLSRIDYASSYCTPAPEGFSEMALSKGDGPTQSIVTNASADSVGRIAELEAEFEAEMEILQLNLANERPFYHHQFSEVRNLELDPFVDVVHGDLNIRGLSGMLDVEEYDDGSSDTPLQPANWSVSPRDLDRRLHILLETRQEERIVELEAELKVAESNLEEKETLLQAWKDRVRHLTELLHSTASGDESTSVTDCTHIQTAGQLEQDSVFGDRHDRIENRLCNLTDDHDCFHSLKNVNMMSAGNSHNYIATSVGLRQEDSERRNAASMGKQLMAFEHANYDTMRTFKLGSGGVTNASSGQECHAILQATSESPKNSQVEQKVDNMADVSFCCIIKPSNDNVPTVNEEAKLPVDEESEHSNTKIGTGYTVQGYKSHTLGSFDVSLSEEENKSKDPQTVHGGPTACSRSLNSTNNSCCLRLSEEGSDHIRSSGLLASESKPFLLFEKPIFLRGTGGEDNPKSSGCKTHYKSRKPSLSIEDIGISRRYDIQDQQCSLEFGSYVAAPANTPIGLVHSMNQQFSHSALQSGIFSSKMAKVYEKMRYWEELSKKEHKKSRKFGPELSVAPEQGPLFWSSQTEHIFPVSFSCSESDFSWDESSATDSEEHLGEALIKRIVEKTRSRSSVMRDVQTMLAELENHETSFCSRESSAQMKLDPESSRNCEHNLNTRVYEGEERDQTPAGLDLITSSHNSPKKCINACRSLFKA